jgi:hypothetical protein
MLRMMASSIYTRVSQGEIDEGLPWRSSPHSKIVVLIF